MTSIDGLEVAPGASATAIARASAEPVADGYVGRRLGVLFWIAVGWSALIVVLALLAPVLTNAGLLAEPNFANTRRINSLISPTHWLGTDHLGRDILSRLIWGTRVSLPVGFASIGLGLLIGGTVGIIGGYLKGWVDNVLMSVMDIVLAFPALLLALSIVSFADRRDVPTIAFAIGIISVPAIARLVRANTLTVREREFVLASRTIGASHARILVREILPNVIPPVISFAVIGVAVAIAAETSLAFLGIGIPLPTASWGRMINEATPGLDRGNTVQVFIPCAVLVITIMAFYIIGDRLGQYFNVKENSL